ncbi:hypothetical protein ACFWNN_28095 [Lentzea sp. NPDC058450]|uniref:hypothetical protein n=1 Tax=Lentzea sp. NPDC058450 TaxID=3346505 RepID=UPI003647F82C
MARRMEMLGRFELDSTSAGVDSGEIWPYCLEPFLDGVTNDTAAFLADLLAFVQDDEGGFATYGASTLAPNLLTEEKWQTHDDALALLDAGIEFKRARNLPSAMLKGYEWARWLEVHGVNTWPHGRPHPPV